MKATKPAGANLALGPPADWDLEKNGPCATLHAVACLDERGNKIIQTQWEPTPEELAALNGGGPVVLTIWGGYFPPLSIDVAPAPEKNW